MRKRGLASTRKTFCTASPSRIHENSSRALGCASRCLILVGACVLACCSIGGACAFVCVSRAAHVGYARSCFRSVGCSERFGQNWTETFFEASDLHSCHPNASGFFTMLGHAVCQTLAQSWFGFRLAHLFALSRSGVGP